MAANGHFFFIIFASALIGLFLPLRLAALSDAVIQSTISSEMITLGDSLDYTVSLIIQSDWPEGSFCIFPEAPDTREAFTLVAAYPGTHIFTADNGERVRVFEMRYRMRSAYLGHARIGGCALQLVNGESLETNTLHVSDSMVLIEKKPFRYIFIVFGICVLGILVLLLYMIRKRRK